MTRPDCTASARRALRSIEAVAPVAAGAILEELAKVRRRVAAGDFRRARAAAESAAELAGRLEHDAALPHRSTRRLALELAELVALLRQEVTP